MASQTVIIKSECNYFHELSFAAVIKRDNGNKTSEVNRNSWKNNHLLPNFKNKNSTSLIDEKPFCIKFSMAFSKAM